MLNRHFERTLRAPFSGTRRTAHFSSLPGSFDFTYVHNEDCGAEKEYDDIYERKRADRNETVDVTLPVAAPSNLRT